MVGVCSRTGKQHISHFVATSYTLNCLCPLAIQVLPLEGATYFVTDTEPWELIPKITNAHTNHRASGVHRDGHGTFPSGCRL
jgi:hypothetical protein